MRPTVPPSSRLAILLYLSVKTDLTVLGANIGSGAGSIYIMGVPTGSPLYVYILSKYNLVIAKPLLLNILETIMLVKSALLNTLIGMSKLVHPAFKVRASVFACDDQLPRPSLIVRVLSAQTSKWR